MSKHHERTYNKIREPLIEWLTTYIDLLEAKHYKFVKSTSIGQAMYYAAISHRRLLWGWSSLTYTRRLNNYVLVMDDYYKTYFDTQEGFLIRRTEEWALLTQHLHLLHVVCGRLLGGTR